MVHISETKHPLACFMSYPFYPHEESEYGIGNYAYEILRNYRKMGFNPYTMTVGDLPHRMGQWPGKEIRFLHLLSSVQADVYHGVDAFSSKTAILLRKRPLIATVHDLVPRFFKTQIGRISYVYNELSMKLARKSDAIIVPFNITKEQVISQYKIDQEKIEVINYGVDHELFRPKRLREDGKNRILYIGELTRLKGVYTLLKAFRSILSSFKDAELIIGGKGEHRLQFERAAVSLGVNRSVRFTGFIPYRQLPYYYRQATVFVWPSLLGFGLTPLQALACGTPVIAASTLDMPEFLGDAGILIQPENHAKLAEAIQSVLSDQELSRSLSIRGLSRACRFSWQRTAKETLMLYEKLASR
jgi:hypothetical protein